MEDLHFMERLDRLGWRETELALRLYREPGLVRLLLDDAKAPEAPRIAIALAASDAPPHVIVARDGAFVTTLGPAMSVGDAPVVPHARIQLAADRHEALRGRLAYIDWAVDNAGSVHKLWRSILTDAHRVPREVIVALAPLIPVFAHALADTWIQQDQLARELVFQHTNRFTRPNPRLTAHDHDILEQIWRRHWATGHLVGLSGLMDRAQLDLVAEQARTRPGGSIFGFHAMRFGFLPTTLRGAWFAARMGGHALRAAKEYLQRDAPAPTREVLAASLQIAFVGAAQARLRAEAEKALKTPLASPLEAQFATVFRAFLAQGLDPEALTDLAASRERLLDFIAAVYEERDYSFGPREHARGLAALASSGHNLYTDPDRLLLIVGNLAWFARADLADFYFTEADTATLDPWKPADTLALIKGTLNVGTWRAPAPERKPPRPGRNDACPCASGKKFKRCCGA